MSYYDPSQHPQPQYQYQQPIQQPIPEQPSQPYYPPQQPYGQYPAQQQPYPQQQMPPMQPQPQYQQPYQPYQQYQPVQQIFIQQPMMMQQPMVQVNIQQKSPSFALRALYFIFIGWWVGFWWLNIGYFLCAIIIGLPVGLMMLNRLPQVMTLKPTSQGVQVNVANGVTSINIGGAQQYNMLLRAVYFVFIGSWAGYIWACLAYSLCLLIVTLPVGLIMFNYLPAVITLRKN